MERFTVWWHTISSYATISYCDLTATSMTFGGSASSLHDINDKKLSKIWQLSKLLRKKYQISQAGHVWRPRLSLHLPSPVALSLPQWSGGCRCRRLHCWVFVERRNPQGGFLMGNCPPKKQFCVSGTWFVFCRPRYVDGVQWSRFVRLGPNVRSHTELCRRWPSTGAIV